MSFRLQLFPQRLKNFPGDDFAEDRQVIQACLAAGIETLRQNNGQVSRRFMQPPGLPATQSQLHVQTQLVKLWRLAGHKLFAEFL
jgi:hypothetical protein